MRTRPDAALSWLFRTRALLFYVVFLCCAAISTGHAAAQEPAKTPALTIRDATLAGDKTHTRLVLWFDGKPVPQWFLLRDPHRLVIDFDRTRFAFDPRKLEAQGLVSGTRYGNIEGDRSRLILSTSGPFLVDGIEVQENEDGKGSRLIADLSATDREKFEAQLRRHLGAPAIASPTAGEVATEKADPGDRHRFTIVLDAGHGGIDGGTQGVEGTPEKTITLAFVLELRKKLEETGDFNVILTRDSDEYISLDRRVEIARQHKADLFISLHADAIRWKSLRGATVYTVSDKASDAAAASTAARENLSDALAGIEVQEEKDDVADILVDLTKRETHSFSMRFARYVLASLSESINMIDTNPHRYAGFRVLEAVDVPSVLIELGYLSNREDERDLRNPEWRAKAADSIVEAVEKFAGGRAHAGG